MQELYTGSSTEDVRNMLVNFDRDIDQTRAMVRLPLFY